MFWGLLAAIWQASVWWLLAWPVPFAWALFNPRRQTLYDLLAGTMLVERSPTPAPPAEAAVR
jgi:uncharacterized RDD family membrane protein YckC